MPENRGLYQKYRVFKVTEDGRIGDEVDEPVFVLTPQTDPIAFNAMRQYSILAYQANLDELAGHINKWLFNILEEHTRQAAEGTEELSLDSGWSEGSGMG